jgi:Zn-dependent protease with chaperone function
MSLDKAARVRLAGIDPAAFRHPLDQRTTGALQRVPGFDRAVAKYIEWGFERAEYHENIASGIRVGPRQNRDLYEMLREACAVLDIGEPELFVRRGTFNAYTSGHNHPYIVLFTELIEAMDADELFSVIAHEVGHVKCGHVLYGTMARMAGGAVGAGLARASGVAVGGIVTAGLRAALRVWHRRAELTADRAALLVVQDSDPCVRMMMKLAGASTAYHSAVAGGAQGRSGERAGLDTEAFLEQARLLADFERDSRLARVQGIRLRSRSDHPLAVERALFFDEWLRGAEPKKILTGEYQRLPTRQTTYVSCPSCAGTVARAAKFCGGCGAGLSVWSSAAGPRSRRR